MGWTQKRIGVDPVSKQTVFLLEHESQDRWHICRQDWKVLAWYINSGSYDTILTELQVCGYDVYMGWREMGDEHLFNRKDHAMQHWNAYNKAVGGKVSWFWEGF